MLCKIERKSAGKAFLFAWYVYSIGNLTEKSRFYGKSSGWGPFLQMGTPHKKIQGALLPAEAVIGLKDARRDGRRDVLMPGGH